MLNPVVNIAPAPRNEAAKTAASPEVQPSGAFGNVLAKQIDSKPASSAATQDSKAAASKKPSADTANNPDPLPTPDAASVALAMLAKQGFKAPVAPVTAGKSSDSKTGADQPLPAAAPDASANPLLLQINPEIKASNAANTAVSTDAAGRKTAGASITAAQLTAAQGKTDPAGGKNDNLLTARLTTSQSDLKASADSFKLAELSNAAPPVQAQVQQAQVVSTSMQANAQGNSANTIAAPLGSSAWPQEFSQRITWLSTQQSQVAELHLNPPDLGPMSVVLSVTDNQATALFTSPHSAVREAIENAMPQLRERLADNGIMLGNATVSDQSSRDSGAGNFASHGNNARTAINGTAESSQTSLPAPVTVTRRHNGILDTFA